MYRNIFIFMLIVTLFSSCSQSKTKEIFQTNSATHITKNYQHIFTLLNSFKTKLDKRNPKQYNKDLNRAIYNQIATLQNKVSLRGLDRQVLKNYKQYLDLAFSSKNIKYRNDYLVLGLYYMVYNAFSLEKGHRLVAMSFDVEKLQKLYKNLQILNWKLKSLKKSNSEFYFATWQNNWQLQLQKTKLKDLNKIYDLPAIKSKKETLMSPSNFSFEVILALMIDDVRRTLLLVGAEPSEIAVEALASLVFLI